MADQNRWLGFQFHVTADSMHKHRFEVDFWPNETVRGGSGEPMEKGTVVTVEAQGELTVIAFHAAKHQRSDFQRGDYEEKALALVREHLSRSGVLR